MAAATIASRYVTVLGPIKMEIFNLTSVSDTNTVVSQLQNPSFAFGVVTSDGSPMTAAINPSISSRTITINSVDLDGDDNVVLIVFGF